MKRKVKRTVEFEVEYEDVVRYLKFWLDHEGWSDFNIMLSFGENVSQDALWAACDWVVSAGAIDPSMHVRDSEAYHIELEIEKMSRKFRKLNAKAQGELLDNMFNGCHLFECGECNHVSYVHDGNHELYDKELETCWDCNSPKITHTVWGAR